jgi:hypothetical protein
MRNLLRSIPAVPSVPYWGFAIPDPFRIRSGGLIEEI